jgi:hypothetical protein
MKSTKLSSERGQALILIALAAIGLFAITALAIDGSRKYADRRHAQDAADTAALAGALELAREETPHPETWDIVARDMADQNGYNGDLVTSQVWVYQCSDDPNDSHSPRYGSPVDCGPYEGDDDYIQVAITSNLNTYFARVIGFNQLHNTVESLAKAQTEYVGQLYGGASIVGLAPDQCKTIWFSGSSDLNITGGGVFSNSSLDCGVTIQGSTNISMDSGIDMVATAYTPNGNPPLDEIDGGIYGYADQYEYPPPAEMLPNPTCDTSASVSGSSMSPGSWSGTFPPSGVTTLDPGTYCVNGSFKLNANDELSGTGVTIFMQSGDVHWNGGAEIDLSAPTSGDFAGLLIYAPMSNTNTMRFNGNGGSTLTGTIFMPAASLIYNGTGGVNPSHVQIIAYTIELTGTNDTNVIYQDSDNWDANTPAQLGLAQ